MNQFNSNTVERIFLGLDSINSLDTKLDNTLPDIVGRIRVYLIINMFRKQGV